MVAVHLPQEVPQKELWYISIILYIFTYSLRRLGDNTFDKLSCDKISAISESESPVYLVLLKSKSLIFEFSGHPIM